MKNIQINAEGRGFVLDGKPFFYLADTIWSAFTNVSMEEWEYYLNQRKFQGFNVLQINTLPQWDRSASDLNIYPFPTEDNHTFHFTSFNEEYFNRAKRMCQMAVDKGFRLELVLLWANYVPETWASAIISDNIMPYDFIKPLIKKIYETFDEFNPIYVVSGDTDFETERAISYYECALDTITKLSPNTLKTLHIRGRYSTIPDSLMNKIDFYMFQSGHNSEYQYMAFELAEKFYNDFPVKPIINSEPCYEQMGYSRKMYGRFRRRDIRKAAWSSILSGACAGVTYGAHGIWNWNKINKAKTGILGEGFDDPMFWEDAVKFPGAWDYGYIKYLFETYNIKSLIPLDIVLNNTKEIRCAKQMDGELIFIYVPTNTKVILNQTFKEYDFKVIDLYDKNVLYPNVNIEEDKTIIQMHNFEEDVLIIGKKK
ncbi:DUF4038 domain-containing protein [Clostridium sp. SYSU_GA19001]|uniref:apiosidase-like domain-containing protein n=1 Tax=Clostridium caldaquaticum TaxID=2940653 RepID=UPI002076F56E|nr:DUF4038 domain-containing protein [Clostridium caldaquaticum]